MQVILLGEKIEGILLHFDPDERWSLPCPDDSTCGRCQANLPRRWKGYCSAFDLVTKELCVVEITEGAARQITKVKHLQPSLRGHKLTLQRHKGQANASVFATLEWQLLSPNLPAAFDIEPHLIRFFTRRGTDQVRTIRNARQRQPMIDGIPIPTYQTNKE